MTKSDILTAALVCNFPAGFRKALSLVLDWECVIGHDGQIEWENVQDDHGGATFAGLTLRDDHLPENPTSHNVAGCYFDNYWTPLNGLPLLIQEVLFFEGVNIGIHTAVRQLQFALNDYGNRLAVDGDLGNETLQAAYQCPDTVGLGMAFLAKCKARYQIIVQNDTAQSKFMAGWLNRVDAAKALLA
jgi:lysozyme family protein